MRIQWIFLALAFVSSVLATVSNLETIFVFNELDDKYDRPGYYSILPGNEYCRDKYRRFDQRQALIDQLSGVSAMMFQEVSVSAPCLTNSSIIIEGLWPAQAALIEAKGFVCYHVPHDQQYWNKYYDYEDCSSPWAYGPSGVALCLNTSDYSDITFFDVGLSTGSHMAMANATFRGTRNRTLASIHFDSDVAGNRKQEFTETFYELFPPSLERPLIACGDYNTFWEPANLRSSYLNSGYYDPAYTLSVALQRPDIIKRSQTLTEGWYNSANHYGPIDHCLMPSGSSVAYYTPHKNNPALYGWPNSTLTGVVDTGIWARYPEIQGFDSNQDARNTAQLCENGSDHIAIMATVVWI